MAAHVTLFHALPGDQRATVEAELGRVAHAHPAFELGVTDVIPLGRGAAYRLNSDALGRIHRELVAAFHDRLTPQDRQPFRAHVTVQNKVDTSTARQTVDELRTQFVPATALARGIALWRYAGGPWEPLSTYWFG